MAHREGIREWLKDVDLSEKQVIDWGCGTKPMKNYLPGAKSYFGVDILDHVGADLVSEIMYVLLDPNKHADVSFCIEVLEHVEYPQETLNAIYENTKIGGILYLSVPFLYPTHSDHDLWRFTEQGLELLLKNAGFKDIEIKSSTNDQQGWLVKANK